MKRFVLILVMFVAFNGIAQMEGRVEFGGGYDAYKGHSDYEYYYSESDREFSDNNISLGVNFSGIYQFKNGITAGAGLGIDNILSSMYEDEQQLSAFVRGGYNFTGNIYSVEVIYGFLSAYDDNYFVKPTVNVNITDNFMVSVGYTYRYFKLYPNFYVNSNGVNVGVSYCIKGR